MPPALPVHCLRLCSSPSTCLQSPAAPPVVRLAHTRPVKSRTLSSDMRKSCSVALRYPNLSVTGPQLLHEIVSGVSSVEMTVSPCGSSTGLSVSGTQSILMSSLLHLYDAVHSLVTLSHSSFADPSLHSLLTYFCVTVVPSEQAGYVASQSLASPHNAVPLAYLELHGGRSCANTEYMDVNPTTPSTTNNAPIEVRNARKITSLNGDRLYCLQGTRICQGGL
jgi:hypothetical protein